MSKTAAEMKMSLAVAGCLGLLAFWAWRDENQFAAGALYMGAMMEVVKAALVWGDE